MNSEKVQAPIIQAGYEWSIRINMPGFTFPPEATFTAQVRRAPAVDDVLVELTTANGRINLVDANTIDIFIRDVDSDGWPDRKVYIDVVRTDLEVKNHLGFLLIVPVRVPVTRLPD